VHVWRARLPSGRDGELTANLLDAEERERAARFVFAVDRDLFRFSHILLRTLLGAYTGERAEALRLSRTSRGKPFLPDHPAIAFSLSHSAEVVLVAIGRERALGVDVERVRDDFATAELATRFFSADETEALAKVPPESRASAFFACWTRKEAYVKARGEGLSIPLSSFSVTLAPGDEAALLRTAEPDDAGRWSLRALDVGPEYAAAAACSPPASEFRLFEWPGDAPSASGSPFDAIHDLARDRE